MRAAILVMLAAAPARAEVTTGFYGHFTHVSGIQSGSLGIDLEHAHPFGQARLFEEAQLGYFSLGDLGSGQNGVFGRLGVGVRWWLWRWTEFAIYAEGGAGVAGAVYEGGHLWRPDVDLGAGYELFGHYRAGIRLVLSHDRDEALVACRGCTVSTPQTVDGAMLFVFGWRW
jgi:hypothetical protein